jgi:hypothetical protein
VKALNEESTGTVQLEIVDSEIDLLRSVASDSGSSNQIARESILKGDYTLLSMCSTELWSFTPV